MSQRKFYSNEERFAHLKELWSGTEAQSKQATKLAWMWLKSGVFTETSDFERCMILYAKAFGT